MGHTWTLCLNRNGSESWRADTTVSVRRIGTVEVHLVVVCRAVMHEWKEWVDWRLNCIFRRKNMYSDFIRTVYWPWAYFSLSSPWLGEWYCMEKERMIPSLRPDGRWYRSLAVWCAIFAHPACSEYLLENGLFSIRWRLPTFITTSRSIIRAGRGAVCDGNAHVRFWDQFLEANYPS